MFYRILPADDSVRADEKLVKTDTVTGTALVSRDTLPEADEALRNKFVFDADGTAIFQRQLYAFGRKHFVHRGYRVQGLRKSYKRRATVNGFPDLRRSKSRVQTRSDVRFQLRQSLIHGQHGHGYQFPQLVVQRALVRHFTENKALQYTHKLRVGPLVFGGRAPKSRLNFSFVLSVLSIRIASPLTVFFAK